VYRGRKKGRMKKELLCFFKPEERERERERRENGVGN
jgi:hypothetical protein